MATPVRAEVWLHNRRVGALAYDRGGATFAYEGDLSSPDHAVLGQVFEDDPSAIRRERVGIPAWFANLLPEGELRRQIVREMGGGNVGDFTLLMRLGEDLPGAVVVRSESEPADDVVVDPAEPATGYPLRHSLAGVQLKFSVSSDRLTFPASGDGGFWIVKLPSAEPRDLATNEYLTMRWLSAAGFPVPNIHLVPAKQILGIAEGLVEPTSLVYLIERFDRSPGGRIHVEDFAQVADVAPRFKYSESGATYDSMAAVLRQVTGEAGYADFVRRLVAMLVVGNSDAHLKNWALLYRDGRTASLAPLYDFHSLTIYGSRYTSLALSLNEKRAPAEVGLDDFRWLAEHAGVDPVWTVELVGDIVTALREAWSGELLAEATVRFGALAAHFSHRLETLPICSVG